MNFTSFSDWLADVTQPDNSYYHPIQLALFTGLTGIGTRCFLTGVSPKRAMTLAALTYTISQFTTPIFIRFLEPHEDVSLVPLFGQVLQVASSAILAKIICDLAGKSISIKGVCKVGGAFVITLTVSKTALLILQEYNLRSHYSFKH